MSGGLVIAGMFGFGLLVVAGFWTYWALYDRPLQPLRLAIAADHPDCFVQIAAGTAKKSDVRELRVVIKTPFDPLASESDSEAIAASVQASVAAWDKASTYEQLEIVLYESLEERRDDYWSRRVPIGQIVDDD